MSDLFVIQRIRLHSGAWSHYKIECDALSDGEIEALAVIAKNRIKPFSNVFGVPRGGIRMANAMMEYSTAGTGLTMIVDDVFTTGASMAEARRQFSGLETAGLVIFARDDCPCPPWITAIFKM